jgi:hypothetical protein
MAQQLGYVPSMAATTLNAPAALRLPRNVAPSQSYNQLDQNEDATSGNFTKTAQGHTIRPKLFACARVASCMCSRVVADVKLSYWTTVAMAIFFDGSSVTTTASIMRLGDRLFQLSS